MRWNYRKYAYACTDYAYYASALLQAGMTFARILSSELGLYHVPTAAFCLSRKWNLNGSEHQKKKKMKTKQQHNQSITEKRESRHKTTKQISIVFHKILIESSIRLHHSNALLEHESISLYCRRVFIWWQTIFYRPLSRHRAELSYTLLMNIHTVAQHYRKYIMLHWWFNVLTTVGLSVDDRPQLWWANMCTALKLNRQT